MIGKLNAGRLSGLALAAGLALSAVCVAAAEGPTLPDGAIAIARQGSFEAGGKVIGDPATKSLVCDHGHVEYEVPVNAKHTALFLWHSSSAAVWQRRWDGGEGYQTKLLRAGYPTYVWDGPRVGRANWGCEDYTYHAQEGRDQGNFGAWRLGPKYGEFYPGEQFPASDPQALEQANRARYDEFDSVANAQLQSDAAAKAIDRIGPSVLLTNSAGGMRALLTALKSDNVKGIVAYENPGVIFPDTMEPKSKEGPFGPIYVSEAEFAKLTRIPIQLVWGDHIDDSKMWAASFAQAEQFAKAVNDRGGQVEILRLTDAGLHGNTHIPFADTNNDEVAKLLFKWLGKNGF
jgi:hypothetical protein